VREEPQWWSRARLLYAAGVALTHVCKRVGKSDGAVRYALDKVGLLQRDLTRPRHVGYSGQNYDNSLVAHHEPRPIRKIVDETAIDAAAHAFAAHEIDRAELMRRITP
jgi:hypothetical protein